MSTYVPPETLHSVDFHEALSAARDKTHGRGVKMGSPEEESWIRRWLADRDVSPLAASRPSVAE